MKNYFQNLYYKLIDYIGFNKFDEDQFGEKGAREVRKLQIKSVYSLTSSMMLGNILFATLLTANMMGKVTWLDNTILSWYMVLVSLSLVVLYKSHQRKKSEKTYSGSKYSIKSVIFSSAILSIIWCFPAIFLYQFSSGEERGVITAIMAGMLFVGASSLARVPKAAILWLLIGGITQTAVTLLAGLKSGLLPDFTMMVFSALATIGLIGAVKSRSEAFFINFSNTLKIKEKSEVINLLLKDYENQATEWLWETDENGIVKRVPQQVLDMLGSDIEKIKQQSAPSFARELSTDECQENLERLMDSLSRREEFHDITLSIKDKRDGSLRWIMTRGKPQWDGDKFLGYRGICADATVAMEAEQNIRHMARHDALTDLANRSTFNDQLHRWNNAKREFSIILIDLDHFKAVNDNYGHSVGDAVLLEVAKRLKEVTAEAGMRRLEECTVSRFGGDEFAITFATDRRNNETQKDIKLISEHISEHIVTAMSKTFFHEGNKIQIGASVGYAIAPEDGKDISRLINRADTALYRAKADGKSTHHRFNYEMDEEKRSTRILELDVSNALKLGQFKIAYQPIVSVEVDAQGEMQQSTKAGMEALIRWEHPTKGTIGPDLFIPIAEETGSIIAIGEWVMKQACIEAASWKDNSSIAVNVSVKQIIAPNFIHTVLGALATSGLPAERLEIEMTESVLITDPELTMSTIRQLRNLGVRVSLDDFGTGYSSLSYIADFDVDRIKIDKSFVEKLSDDNANAAPVIQAITNLASALGLATVGEGVETKEQAEQLTKLGCDHLQGYLYGRPEIRAHQSTSTKKTVDLPEKRPDKKAKIKTRTLKKAS